ncbi:hypothetical protein EVAR_99353_1 [Eumeta japonica]|uniref:Uncharacterized protein n=1 Tax=Eumeta variegata TaxID=151549 RepID=A0A4C1SLV5_EUMVA|nr:hypothetical protein EVAR_99353_1 [Eumeta japonica]
MLWQIRGEVELEAILTQPRTCDHPDKRAGYAFGKEEVDIQDSIFVKFDSRPTFVEDEPTPSNLKLGLAVETAAWHATNSSRERIGHFCCQTSFDGSTQYRNALTSKSDVLKPTARR